MDSLGRRIDSPVIGERVGIRFDYKTFAVPEGASYRASVTIDGVTRTRELAHGAGVSQGSWWDGISGWFVLDRVYEVEVRLNPEERLEESTYSDNHASFEIVPSEPVLPSRFVFPLDAIPSRDVSIGGYVDLDNSNGIQDFAGGNLTYNGHRGIDINPLSIEQVDKGLPVLAVADGTITTAIDGFSDFGGDGGSNTVIVDHGEGWTTTYGHLRRDSIRVSVGQNVSQGDPIALLGGSKDGIEHLHFEVQRHGRSVDPNVLPEVFWVSPEPYSGAVKSVMHIVPTNYDWLVHDTEASQNFMPVHVFTRGHAASPRFYARLHGIWPDDEIHWRFYQPNGSLYASWRTSVSSEPVLSPHTWKVFAPQMPDSPNLGKWRVAMKIGDEEKFSTEVEYVEDLFGVVRVETADGLYLHPHRHRPLTLESGQVTFRVFNHGSGDWSPGEISVPDGFVLDESPTRAIRSGEYAELVVSRDPAKSGYAVGFIKMQSGNDVSWPQTYRIAVETLPEQGGDAQLVIGTEGRVFADGDMFSANVRRTGDLSREMTVSLANSAPANIEMPSEITFGVNQSYKRFDVRHIGTLDSGEFAHIQLLASEATSRTARAEIEIVGTREPVSENHSPLFESAPQVSFAEGDGEDHVVSTGWATNVAPGPLGDEEELSTQSVAFSVSAVDVPSGLMTQSPEVRLTGASGDWPRSADLLVFPSAHAYGTAVYEVTATDDDPVNPRSVHAVADGERDSRQRRSDRFRSHTRGCRGCRGGWRDGGGGVHRV